MMDNSLSSAWAASDESSKAQTRTYSHRAPYNELNPMGGPTDFKELHFFLASAGHVMIENVQLLKNGQPPNVLTNVTRAAMDGSSASGWLWQGNHWASFLTNNGRLHIISEGRGDNRVNRVEIDAPGLTKGDTYELKFDAKWVRARRSSSHTRGTGAWRGASPSRSRPSSARPAAPIHAPHPRPPRRLTNSRITRPCRARMKP